jgi:hypothetical protein
MIPLCSPKAAQKIAEARREAVMQLAMAADCKPSEIVVKDVQTISYARVMESPDGKHRARLEILTMGATVLLEGPYFEQLQQAVTSAAPASAPSPEGGTQADGGA